MGLLPPDLLVLLVPAFAEPVLASVLGGALALLTDEKLDVLAGLRPALNEDVKSLPGARIMEGRYTTVQQAIGTNPKNAAAAAFLRDFVAEAKQSGLVAPLIEKHGVEGRLLVASSG